MPQDTCAPAHHPALGDRSPFRHLRRVHLWLTGMASLLEVLHASRLCLSDYSRTHPRLGRVFRARTMHSSMDRGSH